MTVNRSQVPSTGIGEMPTHRARYDSDIKELRFRLTEKAGPALRRAADLRAQENQTSLKRGEYQHVAGLTMVVVMEIREKYGIDAMNPKPGEARKLHQIVQRDYPLLKTVNKRIG